jgi:hypothetical protein
LTDIVLIVVSLVVVEAVMRLNPLSHAVKLLAISRRSLHVITSRAISDHWKEKALLRYAFIMFGCTLQIFLRLSAALIAGAGLIFLAEYVSDSTLLLAQRLAEPQGLLISSIAAVAYWSLRKHLVSS